MSVFYREEKKIAVPLALFFLLIFLTGLSFTIKHIKTTATQAQKTTTGAVDITNLTNHAVSIAWKTAEKEIGWVVYGESKNGLNETGFDDRDTNKRKNSYRNHQVTLKNLKEQRNYFFKIVSDKRVITSGNNSPFTFRTTISFKPQHKLQPAFGKVVNKNGTPVAYGLVMLKIDGAHPLSTLTKTTGEWLIPLYYLVDRTTGQPFFANEKTPALIELTNDEGETARVTTTISTLSPLPKTIIIGQQIELQEDTTRVLAESTNLVSNVVRPIDIIFPKANSVIPGRRPLIKGVAQPSQKLTLTLKSASRQPQVFEIAADSEGIWTLTIPYDLPEENHVLTVKTPDRNGQLRTVKRAFAIAKSGQSVLGQATPEATVTQLPSPTTSPAEALPATPPPPVTGVNDLSLSLFGAGLLIVGLGFLLIL